MPVTIDQMTVEVETAPEHRAATGPPAEPTERLKQELVRAVLARLASRALRLRAD